MGKSYICKDNDGNRPGIINDKHLMLLGVDNDNASGCVFINRCDNTSQGFGEIPNFIQNSILRLGTTRALLYLDFLTRPAVADHFHPW